MGDPYWRYGVPVDGAGSIPRPSFPGYLPSEASMLTPHHPLISNDLRGGSSDYLHKDILSSRPGAYGLHHDYNGIGVRAERGLGGYPTGASMIGYPPHLEDPSLLRRDVSLPGIENERPSSLRNVDPVGTGESNILFVDGLPDDCSRREASHLFRPFIGFREIRVVHKEPKRSGDKALVLCFVEFADAKCAVTAFEALQGYKFDNKKPESPALRLHFAHFPFSLPSDREERRFVASH